LYTGGGSSFTITGITTNTYTAYISGSITDNTTVYWYVTAADAETTSVTPEQGGPPVHHKSVLLNTVNEPPLPFSLYYTSGIYSAAFNSTSTWPLSLRWQLAVDPDPGDSVNYYTVYYSSYQNFVTSRTITGLKNPTTSLIYANLQDNSTFWWYVVAVDSFQPFNYGVKTTSSNQMFSFVVDAANEAPYPFNLSSPVNNFVIINSTVYFSWQPAVDPDPGDYIASYVVFLSTVYPVTASSPNLPSTNNTNAITPSPLIENATYWWFAKAFDKGRIGWTGQSGQLTAVTSTWSFIINKSSEASLPFNLLFSSGAINTVNL
jgi:hypothetical protein